MEMDINFKIERLIKKVKIKKERLLLNIMMNLFFLELRKQVTFIVLLKEKNETKKIYFTYSR